MEQAEKKLTGYSFKSINSTRRPYNTGCRTTYIILVFLNLRLVRKVIIKLRANFYLTAATRNHRCRLSFFKNLPLEFF